MKILRTLVNVEFVIIAMLVVMLKRSLSYHWKIEAWHIETVISRLN